MDRPSSGSSDTRGTAWELRIAQRTVGPVTILTLSGPLVYDHATRQVREAITAATGAGALAILLDLEHVTRLDSDGVGLLVAMFRHVTRRGGQLKLLRPSPTARRVLGIAHMTMVFDVFDDEREALLNLGTTTD
jgi:anti-anti-sigma factor